jgi:hypothetical protein
MNLSVKLAVGAALTIASVGAFANSLPSGGDGSLYVTIFSENDATPFSYAFDTGTTFSQNGVAALSTPGTKIVYNLTGLAADLAANPAAAAGGLVFDVVAGSQSGGIQTVGSFKLEMTFDNSVSLATVQGIQSGAVSAGVAATTKYLTNITVNPFFTTNTSDPAYANANYNAALETFAVNSAGSTSESLPFYLLTSARGTTSIGTTTQYAGTWSVDLTKDTLTYTVAGGGTAPVPLPASVWLMISGLAGVAVLGRRRKNSGMDFSGAAA